MQESKHACCLKGCWGLRLIDQGGPGLSLTGCDRGIKSWSHTVRPSTADRLASSVGVERSCACKASKGHLEPTELDWPER